MYFNLLPSSRAIQTQLPEVSLQKLETVRGVITIALRLGAQARLLLKSLVQPADLEDEAYTEQDIYQQNKRNDYNNKRYSKYRSSY